MTLSHFSHISLTQYNCEGELYCYESDEGQAGMSVDAERRMMIIVCH
jgi:hypothetical protein